MSAAPSNHRPGRTAAAWTAAVAGAWTVLVWGGRIGLLTGDEAGELRTWLRVGGSLALGIAVLGVAVAALRGAVLGRAAAWLFFVFAVWQLFIWVPDVVDLAREDRSAGFVAVHSALAAISVGLGLALAAEAQRIFRATVPRRIP